MRSGRIPRAKLLCPQDSSPSQHMNVYQQPDKLTQAMVQNFGGFHYVGMIETLATSWISVSSSLTLPGGRAITCGSTSQPFNHMFGL